MYLPTAFRFPNPYLLKSQNSEFLHQRGEKYGQEEFSIPIFNYPEHQEAITICSAR